MGGGREAIFYYSKLVFQTYFTLQIVVIVTRPSALGMSDPIVDPLEIMGTQESSKVLEGP